jgi:hypothetical protein
VDINNRLAIEGEFIKVIPRLITRLVVKDIDPKNFIPELADELELSFSAAKALAQEVEEKILRPVELPLRSEAGVDTKLIYFAEEMKVESPIVAVLREEEKPAQPVPTPITPPSPMPSRPTPPPIPPRPSVGPQHNIGQEVMEVQPPPLKPTAAPEKETPIRINVRKEPPKPPVWGSGGFK